MIGFQTILLDFLSSCDVAAKSCPGGALSAGTSAALAIGLAALVGAIAYRGAEGSTKVAIAINAVQLSMLVFFSASCLTYRARNPFELQSACGTSSTDTRDGQCWSFSRLSGVLAPHSAVGTLMQASVAILILVGFDSATSMGDTAVHPQRDIPRGVLLSLGIQGGLSYTFEYFAALAAFSTRITTSGTSSSGLAAAAASEAPIGLLSLEVGDAMLGGGGFGLMVCMALSSRDEVPSMGRAVGGGTRGARSRTRAGRI